MRNTGHLGETVRGFYADLIQLAHQEPARWAPWACRCPVSEAEVKAYRKWRRSLQSEMHERTRARAVRVGELADAAERNYRDMSALLSAAHEARPGERFLNGPTTYMRVDHAAHELAHPKVAAVNATDEDVGVTLDMVFEEEDAVLTAPERAICTQGVILA
jgi:hypothetical protein